MAEILMVTSVSSPNTYQQTMASAMTARGHNVTYAYYLNTPPDLGPFDCIAVMPGITAANFENAGNYHANCGLPTIYANPFVGKMSGLFRYGATVVSRTDTVDLVYPPIWAEEEVAFSTNNALVYYVTRTEFAADAVRFANAAWHGNYTMGAYIEKGKALYTGVEAQHVHMMLSLSGNSSAVLTQDALDIFVNAVEHLVELETATPEPPYEEPESGLLQYLGSIDLEPHLLQYDNDVFGGTKFSGSIADNGSAEPPFRVSHIGDDPNQFIAVWHEYGPRPDYFSILFVVLFRIEGDAVNVQEVKHFYHNDLIPETVDGGAYYHLMSSWGSDVLVVANQAVLDSDGVTDLFSAIAILLYLDSEGSVAATGKISPGFPQYMDAWDPEFGMLSSASSDDEDCYLIYSQNAWSLQNNVEASADLGYGVASISKDEGKQLSWGTGMILTEHLATAVGLHLDYGYSWAGWHGPSGLQQIEGSVYVLTWNFSELDRDRTLLVSESPGAFNRSCHFVIDLSTCQVIDFEYSPHVMVSGSDEPHPIVQFVSISDFVVHAKQSVLVGQELLYFTSLYRHYRTYVGPKWSLPAHWLERFSVTSSSITRVGGETFSEGNLEIPSFGDSSLYNNYNRTLHKSGIVHVASAMRSEFDLAGNLTMDWKRNEGGPSTYTYEGAWPETVKGNYIPVASMNWWTWDLPLYQIHLYRLPLEPRLDGRPRSRVLEFE